MNAKDLKKLEEVLVQVGLRIAKRGEGALFVVGDVEYKTLIDQTVPAFKVIDNPKLLESLALMDGAIIIDENGMLKAYGAMIKSTLAFKNFGTRHSGDMNENDANDAIETLSKSVNNAYLLGAGNTVETVINVPYGVEDFRIKDKMIEFLIIVVILHLKV